MTSDSAKADLGKSLTPLGISVLALLAERPMHPYEMYQLLVKRREDRIVKVRPGSLYHAVARLELQKLVRDVGTDRGGNRPERTTYEVTDEGRAALKERIADVLGTPAREYPIFPLALAESHNLDPENVVTLLRRRTVLLEKDIEELDLIGSLAQESAVPRVFWLVAEYLRAMQETEMNWLNRLAGEIESGELPWLDEAMCRTMQADNEQTVNEDRT